MTRRCCPNCGLQIDSEPQYWGDVPLEEVVAEDDYIRSLQYQAARAGIDYRHSANIASNFPVEYGGADGH